MPTLEFKGKQSIYSHHHSVPFRELLVDSKKEKLVFATAKYRGQKELSAQNITFCQLPYSIHRVVGAYSVAG